MIVRIPYVEGLGDQRLRLLERPERRVDDAVVGDVVAAVGERREVPRREPDGVDAEVAQVGQPGADAGEVAGPVAVAVGEAADVDLVDHRAPPPQGSAVRSATAAARAATVRLGERGDAGRRRSARPVRPRAVTRSLRWRRSARSRQRRSRLGGNVAHPTK